MRAVMGKLENRRCENDTAKRAADWLSGAKMAESDADPTDTTPTSGLATSLEGYGDHLASPQAATDSSR